MGRGWSGRSSVETVRQVGKVEQERCMNTKAHAIGIQDTMYATQHSVKFARKNSL